MDTKRTLTILGLIILIFIVLNESRFILFGPMGVPKSEGGLNCGEIRYDFSVAINSKTDFLDFIQSFRNTTLHIYEGMPEIEREREYLKQDLITFARETDSLENFKITTSSSLLFRQKWYSITYLSKTDWPCHLTLTMNEKGYTAVSGCCGI